MSMVLLAASLETNEVGPLEFELTRAVDYSDAPCAAQRTTRMIAPERISDPARIQTEAFARVPHAI
jgi:hypothetical protein